MLSSISHAANLLILGEKWYLFTILTSSLIVTTFELFTNGWIFFPMNFIFILLVHFLEMFSILSLFLYALYISQILSLCGISWKYFPKLSNLFLLNLTFFFCNHVFFLCGVVLHSSIISLMISRFWVIVRKVAHSSRWLGNLPNILLLYFQLLLWNNYRSTENCKLNRKRSSVPFIQFPPVTTSYIIIVQCPNNEISISAVHIIFTFHQVYIHSFVCVWLCAILSHV